LQAICIPYRVEILGKHCFAAYQFKPSAVLSLTFEGRSKLKQIEDCCSQYRRLASIILPHFVEFLGKSIFELATIEMFKLEDESKLICIEESCFRSYALREFCIPEHVNFIDGSAFIDASLCFAGHGLKIDPRNQRFVITRGFLVDKIGSIAVRFSGSALDASIWWHIKILGRSCFEETRIQQLAFERGSQLARMKTTADPSPFAQVVIKGNHRRVSSPESQLSSPSFFVLKVLRELPGMVKRNNQPSCCQIKSEE
jgi:hypothetical protein